MSATSGRTSSVFVLLIVAANALVALPARAQTRRALLIGIDHYAPPTKRSRALDAGRSPDSVRGPIGDLEGAVNDARAMSGVLIGRYGYDSSKVRTIIDSAATRAGILREIEALGERSASGDFVVFYYAGHGSEQRNSKSREARGLDQTIVPFDANLTRLDIRDKELARAFNRLIDRGVQLTLIFDSCHSGSVARSPLAGAYRSRWAPFNPVDALDGDVAPPPEARGALVLSAAQDFELANEVRDAEGTPHGAFTSALIQVLLAQSPNAPATRTFAQARAILRADGLRQEPVLQGRTERTRRALLLPDGATPRDRIAIAIQRIRDDSTVEIDGGPATGLVSGVELRALDSARSSDRLVVTGAVSAVRSLAVRRGAGVPKIGDLYEIDRWPAAAASGVSVWMDDTALPDTALAEIVRTLNAVARRTDLEWVPDPSNTPASPAPSVLLRYAPSGWELHGPLDTTRLGMHPTATELASAALELGNAFRRVATADARAGAHTPVRLSAILPPSRALAQRLRPASQDSSSVVRFVSAAADANYLLVSRPGTAGRLEYAWMRPNASRDSTARSALPSRTRWVGGSDSVRAERLLEDALTLARVRSWLLLQAPPGSRPFPYHLSFRSARSKRVTTTGPFHANDTLTIVLQLDSTARTDDSKPRRVYVFSIDAAGTGAALFPSDEGNNGNIVPAPNPSGPRRWLPDVSFPADPIEIGEPYGLDTYIMITVPASETIPLDLLSWSGVRSVPTGGSPLTRLLYGASSATRSPRTIVPMDWSIERLSIPSLARAP